ncbi:MAG: hypothetical protein DK306_001003 [Chloroflexi bacterium]|nr:MAG: hypothetical protein DK306_001003 [Chloroflexota bacterium]
MTTSATGLTITYEAEALTFGGYAAADFFVQRAGHHSLEVNLGLAADAQALFQAHTAPLDNDAVQAILRALAGRVYRTFIDAGHEPPAILLLRAADIDAHVIADILSEASLA